MRRIAAGVVILASFAVASAQGKRGLELADFYRFQSVSDPQMSPDGRRVAFVRSVIVEDDNARRTEIWLAPADGSAPPAVLPTPGSNATAPRWNADGSLLSFSARPSGGDPPPGPTIWFLRPDEPARPAFQIPGVDGSPVFSPDGRWIAFTKAAPASKPPLPATEFERKIAERFKGRLFDWMNYRFDGRGYLPDPRDPGATPPREIYIVPVQGGTPRQLTSIGVDVQDFAWRPDSQAIAFVANSHQRDEYVYERADVWVTTIADGARHVRLTDDGFDHDSVAWAPDGQTLFFRRQMGLNQVIASKQQHGAPIDVFAMSIGETVARAGDLRNLTAAWDLLPGRPVVSADGTMVYFSGGIAGNDHLFRVGSTGGMVQQVTRGDRQLASFSVSRGFDRWAYTATDVQHPGEIYSAGAEVAEATEQRLSAFNEALLGDVQVAGAERIVARSKDGTEVEGWLMRPRGTFAASSRWPMILAMHGGPHSAYGNSFAFQFQLWSSNGYAVLYTNPRGSTGYGEKFLWGTWGGWGHRDFEDVMAVVDESLKRYPIDPRRMGVTGYSYGGFLTNWVITQTPRFAAAIVGAGISNWVSDYGTADIPRTKETEFNGPPWEKASLELLMKQSPVIHARNVSTPTLFVHGEADLRVPIEQAEQMYVALKKRRVPAQFIRYPDMYHGGWTPWNTVHRYHHELAWWARYLAPRLTVSQ